MVSLVLWPAASGPIGGAVEYVLNCVKLDDEVPVPTSITAPTRSAMPPPSGIGIFGVSKEITPAAVNLFGRLPLAPGPGTHGMFVFRTDGEPMSIGVLLAVCGLTVSGLLAEVNVPLQMP